MHTVVVGGGASGIAIAVMLLRHAQAGDHVTHVDLAPNMGIGAAYSTPDETLLLNVRVYNMSIYADAPSHFADWVADQYGQHDTNAFVPRHWYARYLRDTLTTAIRTSAGHYTQIQAQVCDIEPHQRTVILHDGQRIMANQVVLALGHAPIANPLSRYVASPTRIIAGYDWQGIAREIAPHQPVLIIGTGLTMVDAVSTLWQSGHHAPITAISRHGHLPQAHVVYAPHTGYITPADYGISLRHLMRTVRREVTRAHQQGQPWQAVIDAIRPHTQSLWISWSLADKQRFLRHVRAHWDIYRHRIAPHLATQLSAAQHRGQLAVVAGRITNYREDGDGVTLSYTPRGRSHGITHTATWVINCTGPESDYTRITNPLVTALTRRGLLNADPIRLGIDVDAQGHLKDRDGHIIPWLWSIGPPRKGYAWECIAIPDIRVQAAQLADALIAAS